MRIVRIAWWMSFLLFAGGSSLVVPSWATGEPSFVGRESIEPRAALASYSSPTGPLFAASTAPPALPPDKEQPQLNKEPSQPTTEHERRLIISGSEQILWIALEQWDVQRKQFVTQLWTRSVKDDRALPYRQPLQTSRIAKVATVGDVLDVFFDDGVHFQFLPRNTRRAIRLPGAALPLATTGELRDGAPLIWAIVPSNVADQISQATTDKSHRDNTATIERNESGELDQLDESEKHSTITDTQPKDASAVSNAVHKTMNDAAGSLAVVIYEGQTWQVVANAPEECSHAERFWLAAADRRLHLFWQHHASDLKIYYARFENGQWAKMEPIRLASPVQTAAVSIHNKLLHFVALTSTLGQSSAISPSLVSDPSSALQCERWSRGMAQDKSASPVTNTGAEIADTQDSQDTQAWTLATPLNDDQGQVLQVSTGSQVGLLGDRIAIVRMGGTGDVRGDRPELGFWEITRGDGKPVQPFAVLPSAIEDLKPWGNLIELARLSAFVAVGLLVYWRWPEIKSGATRARQLRSAHDEGARHGEGQGQEFYSAEAEIIEIQIAPPSKRVLAFIIDLIPATVFVSWFWAEPLMKISDDVQRTIASGDYLTELPTAMLWVMLWFRVIYTIYCFIFEIVFATTPGKRLLGCWVLSESFERASLTQIVIRNVLRMVELEPLLSILPTMIVLFFTRRCQRIGDLLARTIVVERRWGSRLHEDESSGTSGPQTGD